jgi:hypothetical protein
MNKKYTLTCSVVMLLTMHTIQANLQRDKRNFSIQARASAFIPYAQRFRSIYGATPCVGLEVTRNVRQHIAVWANGDAVFACGSSIGFCNPTKVRIANLSLGLKFPYDVGCHSTLYFGTGPSFGALWLTNTSPFCCEKVFQNAIGVAVKAGWDFLLNDRVFFAFFADYLYQPVRFTTLPCRLDCGGLKAGIGLGVRI